MKIVIRMDAMVGTEQTSTTLSNQGIEMARTMTSLDIDNAYQAFGKIYTSYYANLTYFAMRYMKTYEASSEVVSEVFYKLWKKRDEICISSSLHSYLFTSVRNRCLDIIRSKSKYSESDDSMLITHRSSNPTPLQTVVGSELGDKISATIDRLPPDRRRIFKMSRDEGLKYKEIADQLGISIKTVETQMGRSLKFLRQELSEYLGNY